MGTGNPDDLRNDYLHIWNSPLQLVIFLTHDLQPRSIDSNLVSSTQSPFPRVSVVLLSPLLCGPKPQGPINISKYFPVAAMDVTLRPLNLAEILDRTFQLYRTHFLLFTGIASLAAAVDLLLRASQTIGAQAIGAHHGSRLTLLLFTGITVLIEVAVGLVVAGITLAALAHAVSGLYRSANAGVRLAYAQVWPHWFRYTVVSFCAMFVAWLPVAAIAMGVGAAIALRSRTATVLASCLLFLSVPWCVWLMVRYSLANTVSVFEGLWPVKALERSAALTKSRRGAIFVGLLVCGAVQGILGFVLEIPLGFLIFLRHTVTAQHLLFASNLYLLVVRFVSNSLCMPLYGIVLTLFYYDTRVRKEGLDIEWMLESAAQPNPLTPLDPRPSLTLPQAGLEPQ